MENNQQWGRFDGQNLFSSVALNDEFALPGDEFSHQTLGPPQLDYLNQPLPFISDNSIWTYGTLPTNSCTGPLLQAVGHLNGLLPQGLLGTTFPEDHDPSQTGFVDPDPGLPTPEVFRPRYAAALTTIYRY